MVEEEKSKEKSKEEHSPKSPAEPEKKSKKRLIIILAAAVVVVVVGGVAAFLFLAKHRAGKQQKSAGEEMIEQIQSDAEAAKAESGKTGEEEKPKGKSETAKEGKGKEEGNKQVEEEEDPLVFKMKPVTANLNEPNFKRMVAIEFVVKARDAAALTELKQNSYRIRDTIIGLLSNKTQADLKSEAGKELLKLEVKVRIDQVVGKEKAVFVGFQNFYFF